NHRGHRRIVPRPQPGRRAYRRRTGDVALTQEDRLIVNGLEPEHAQLREPGVELLAGERTGRRDDRDAIARAERARLAPHATRASGDRLASAAQAQVRGMRSEARGDGARRSDGAG